MKGATARNQKSWQGWEKRNRNKGRKLRKERKREQVKKEIQHTLIEEKESRIDTRYIESLTMTITKVYYLLILKKFRYII